MGSDHHRNETFAGWLCLAWGDSNLNAIRLHPTGLYLVRQLGKLTATGTLRRGTFRRFPKYPRYPKVPPPRAIMTRTITADGPTKLADKSQTRLSLKRDFFAASSPFTVMSLHLWSRKLLTTISSEKLCPLGAMKHARVCLSLKPGDFKRWEHAQLNVNYVCVCYNFT